MDNNENKLPDFLNDLISKEKSEGIRKFNNSDFEKKIYYRIRDQKRSRQVSLKWILFPASLILIFISALFLKEIDNNNLSGKHEIQLVLESVINEKNHSRKVSAEFLEVRRKFEILQNEILNAGIRRDIGTDGLSEQITSSMFSATGEYKPELRLSGKYNRDGFLQIKEDIANMNKKDDYSELFSRIIIKLTEG